MNDWEVRVISESQQMRDRIRWLEDGLRKLITQDEYFLGSDLREIAQALLDGEPTTADEYNKSQKIEGIELKHEDRDTMQEDEKLVFKEQFGGDTGVDADYLSKNDKQHDKNAEIAEYDRKYWEEEE